jgi:hypothetical protein
MGGRAGLESDGVHGSTFWIELPTAPGASNCKEIAQNASAFETISQY